MGIERVLTESEMAKFRSMVESGLTSSTISRELRAGYRYIENLREKIYGDKEYGLPVPVKEESDIRDLRRGPKPPGDPATWGAITSGTLLEGTPYPYPKGGPWRYGE